MSPFAPLEGLRVGCVQYLNAKPLIAPYQGPVIFEHPARLADLLAQGGIDLALVPAFEALRQPTFPIAAGVSISSTGPVYSVFLAFRGELRDLHSIYLDPASRTSNNLLRCLLAEFYGLHPRYVAGVEKDEPCASAAAEIAPGTGRLLIGNQAIHFRSRVQQELRYLDFGEEWLRQTGLPFVYAVWQIRPEVPNPGQVAEALRALKSAGVRRAAELGRTQTIFPPEFGVRYLTEHIQFDLGPEEEAGLLRFRALLQAHGLLPASALPLRFV